MSEHTPTPWHMSTVATSVGVCHKIGPLGFSTKIHYACLYDDCYSDIARDLVLLADAEFIVRAVNNFDALLAACKRAKKLLEPEVTKEPDRTIFWELVKAIADAEKESHD